MEEQTHPQEHNVSEIAAKVVAILFSAGDPVSIQKLARSLGIKPTELRAVVEHVSADVRQLGLAVARDDNTLQLVTAPEMSDDLVSWGKELKDSPLSPAAIETVSVVAYLGGATKAEIDFVRGVNSTITLRTLATRGLLNQEGEGDIARYQITIDALKGFGCTDVRDLPDWKSIHRALREQLGEQSVAVVE